MSKRTAFGYVFKYFKYIYTVYRNAANFENKSKHGSIRHCLVCSLITVVVLQ
jgi:hypothetical protein